jgi:Flp pilus assembly protein TadD
MSIIYATLESLETEESPRACNEDKTCSPPRAGEPRGFPVKTVVAAMLVVIAGAGLMFWQQSAGVGDPRYLAPVTEQYGVPAAATQIEVAVVTDVQHVAVQEESPELEAIEEPAVVVEVTADTESSAVTTSAVDSSPVAIPETAPAQPAERKPVPASNTAQTDGVEEVIEQARLALSRGRYQQALSALEALAPVPENRADFWLIKGSAHLVLGQLDPAEVAFASAQALAPYNVQIALQQAILKQEKGDHASALEILNSAAIRHPYVPEIFLNQGYSQQALGDLRNAKRSFRAFLRMTESRSLYLEQRKVVKKWLAQVSSIHE